jgi:hypothetical protein
MGVIRLFIRNEARDLFVFFQTAVSTKYIVEN